VEEEGEALGVVEEVEEMVLLAGLMDVLTEVEV
jgi:hypothetical protein